MLKKRIIPTLLFKERTIVKSTGFGNFRMVGDPTTCARVYNQRNADELVFVDIMASRESIEPNIAVMEDIARECYMPLSIGGGITRLEHADRLFATGADKLIICTALVKDPQLIRDITGKYGSQAVIAAIDHISNETYVKGGDEKTKISLKEHVELACSLSVGEILLTSIEKDGTREGYDLEAIKLACKCSCVPVLANGGAGKLEDFDLAFQAGADAVCASSIFLYVGESMITAKKYLSEKGWDIRVI
jgi:cyclase